MTTTMTRSEESIAETGSLLVAFELSARTWKLGFSVGRGQRPRLRQIPAGALERLTEEIARAEEPVGRGGRAGAELL